jgi:hypothetical protein
MERPGYCEISFDSPSTLRFEHVRVGRGVEFQRGGSVEGLLEMRTKAAEETVRALRGGKLINCVNAQWLPEAVRERVLVGTPPTV